MKTTLVLGARPQIIKCASLIHLASKSKETDLDIIHTGQHYDYEMTKIFFEQFNLPDPILNLKIGSGSHAQQTSRIMTRLEKILRKQKPDFVVVPGDTNSTLAVALTAAKLHNPVAHIEAGARSYDMKMPEEVNRRLTDHCSTILFTPTGNCTDNLLKEGIDRNKIHQVGDTMYDVLLQQMPKVEKEDILKVLKLERETYALLTIHRPENVDNPRRLRSIINAIIELKPLKFIFPAHPRTQRQLLRTKLYSKIQSQNHIFFAKPFGYHETLKLVNDAKLLITDSGGMQKEAFWLKTPCITLRDNTEWTETIQLGANHLTGARTQKIVETVREIIENKEQKIDRLKKLTNPYGDGRASEKILEIIRAC